MFLIKVNPFNTMSFSIPFKVHVATAGGQLRQEFSLEIEYQDGNIDDVSIKELSHESSGVRAP